MVPYCSCTDVSLSFFGKAYDESNSTVSVQYLQKSVTFFPPSHFDSKTSFAVLTAHCNVGETCDKQSIKSR